MSIRNTALAAMAALTLAACGGDDSTGPVTALTPEQVAAKMEAVQQITNQPLLAAVFTNGGFFVRANALQPARIGRELVGGLRGSLASVSAPTSRPAAAMVSSTLLGHVYRQTSDSTWELRTGAVASNMVRLEYIDVNTGAVVGTVDITDQSTSTMDKFFARGTAGSAVLFELTNSYSNIDQTTGDADVAVSGFVQNGDRRITFSAAENMNGTATSSLSAPFIGFSATESYAWNETTNDETGEVVVKLEGSTFKVTYLPISGGHDYTKVYLNGTLVATGDDLADGEWYTPSGQVWDPMENEFTSSMFAIYMVMPAFPGYPYQLMWDLGDVEWSTAP